jgi:hypothetical protein
MYDGVEFVDAFGSAFTAYVARERPANPANEYAFAPDGARMQDGMIVRVVPNEARPWYGMFADGISNFSPAASGLFAAPDPNRLFAVSYGNAYLIDVRSPALLEMFFSDVSYVVPIPSADMLVVADNDTVFGIGRNAISWERTFDVDGFSEVGAVGGFFTACVNRRGGGTRNLRLDASSGDVLGDDLLV